MRAANIDALLMDLPSFVEEEPAPCPRARPAIVPQTKLLAGESMNSISQVLREFVPVWELNLCVFCHAERAVLCSNV